MLRIYFYLNHDFFLFFLSTVTDFSEFYGKEKKIVFSGGVYNQRLNNQSMVCLGPRLGIHPALLTELGFWQKKI